MSGSGDAEDSGARLAVVGMAGRFAGAGDVDALWRNLRGGVESIQRYTDEELLAAGVPRALVDDPNYVRAGAPLPDMEKFDGSFFGFSPLDASIMDPQHRHFLECCWEAFEGAAIDPTRFPGSVGVFAGCGHGAYLSQNLLSNPALVDDVGFFLLRHTGNDKDFLATRVSYEFDLRGPAVSVQTACSTSLVAIHLAAQSLLNGECDLALAGGSTVELPHRHGYLYRDGEILSPDGHCRSFDAGAAGTVFGSGVGVVLLRRLEDALADGDPVLAVVLGSAVNNDGSSKVGYLAPSVDGQAAAVAEALALAEVDPRSIRYVECHGTGTPIGDPIEVAALTSVYRRATDDTGFCAIGSVKPNIGHTDTAAGVASFIKVVQALRHREIPPTLHFRAPNPELGLEQSPFYVNAELEAWERTNGPRRAALSSLGVGGTNAHVLLEEAPDAPGSASSQGKQLLLLSGRSEAVVQRAAERLADHLREAPDASLADVAHTLRLGRRHFRHRRAVVCEAAADAIAKLEEEARADQVAGEAPEAAPALAFLFPGGGAQYPGMGRRLYADEPIFRERVDEAFGLLEPELARHIRPLLLPDGAPTEEQALEFERPSLQLPALFIVEYALARLLMERGFEPTALAGHSMGENTAACLAGVLSLRDALGLVSLRGRLFEQVPEGTMLSVPLPAEELEALLGDDLQLASANAPELSVASGPIAAIERLEAQLAEREIECRRVRIRIAAHSAMLDPILPEWRAYLRSIELSPPRIPIASNTTGAWLTDEEATDPEYWVRHLRSTVRFGDDVATLLAGGPRALLEVGPGRTLVTLARMHPAATRESVMLPSLPHPDDAGDDLAFFLGAIGRLWTGGCAPAWERFDAHERRRRIGLPTYPWQHQRHWVDAGEAAAVHAGGAVARESDVGRFLQVVGWHPVAPARARREGPVLAFVDDAPAARALLDGLRADGRKLIEVRPGRKFASERDGFRVRPGESADYEALLEHLGGEVPADWLHLWNLGTAAAHEEQVTRAFSSLLALAQAVGNFDLSDALRLHVLTAGVHGVGGETPGVSEQALSLGPCRVIPNELPNLRCRNVDLPAGAETPVAAVLAEIGDASEDIVALRGGERFAPSFTALASGEPAQTVGLRPGGVYLVTGGLGGLGLALARHLAERVGARLALVSRRAAPPREQWDERLRAIEEAGGEVELYSADVCDADAMRDVIARVIERFGALHGVVHAAGALDDELIQMKSAESAARVLAPKVAGARALDAALRDVELDFLWLYSSVSAWAGLPGQIDYAAANAFLDAFARERSARAAGGGPTLSIGWGAWREVGMAAALAGGAQGAPVERELAHPLLTRRIERPDAEISIGALSPADHWVLEEHRLEHGRALLPGTAYLELARAAVADDAAGRPIELSGVLLLSPFDVDDGTRRELRLRYDRQEHEFAVASPVEEAFVEHARGSARVLEDAGPPPTHPLEELRRRCSERVLEGEKTPKPAHLQLGRRWESVRRVGFGAGEALAELELDAEFHGDSADTPLHPALLDMATGCAHALIDGHETERDLFVPISYGRVVVRASLPPRFSSHLRLRAEKGVEDFAIFDVTLIDETGAELVSVEELMLKRVQDEEMLAGQAPPLADAAEFADAAPVGSADGLAADLRSAIATDEGMAAVDRLLAAGLRGHAFVSPHPVGPWLADLAARAKPAESAAARLDPATLAELEHVGEVIAAAEGVAEATVTAHFDRPGERRLLAHVVWEPDHDGTVSELRRALRRDLGDDLVPQNFVELDALPRAADGAVDTAALEDPFGISDDYVAPRTPTEKTLAKVWKQILGIDRVGAYDNFFDIGGHSLLAMRAIVRIDKELKVRLNNAIMVLQTLEQVAAECDRQLGNDAPEPGPEVEPSRGLGGRLFQAVKRGLGER